MLHGTEVGLDPIDCPLPTPNGGAAPGVMGSPRTLGRVEHLTRGHRDVRDTVLRLLFSFRGCGAVTLIGSIGALIGGIGVELKPPSSKTGVAGESATGLRGRLPALSIGEAVLLEDCRNLGGEDGGQSEASSAGPGPVY